jgi:hypothetical protein
MPMLFFGWEGGFVFSIVGALAAYVAVAWFTSRRPQVATAD